MLVSRCFRCGDAEISVTPLTISSVPLRATIFGVPLRRKSARCAQRQPGARVHRSDGAAKVLAGGPNVLRVAYFEGGPNTGVKVDFSVCHVVRADGDDRAEYFANQDSAGGTHPHAPGAMP